MDETVLRAMQKWPNVPAVYGWLALDRRGNWLIKTVAGQFEPVTNRSMIDFIGRNYAHDVSGRWFLQNGPQRVFVALHYTPWIYRLDDTSTHLVAHTGAAAQDVRALFLDDAGALLIETELGIGVLLDRDLAALLEQLRGSRGEDAETVLDVVQRGEVARGRLFGRELRIEKIRAAEVAARFHYDPRPTPPPGQPDC